ncbi:MAG: ParB/RepB/Spo0J family partition protein [Plectolyngbya sp. WJT66-NPBG17]|jgi:ParB family chromosome partitioning protein|nr:ParB/RepB/Spo0J family partition protein [Plectolyngbya sp. WJT66-NPBG17]MBW4528981.1 ParB/RepB/Spo0J family partition protein [Phormidium tanganyikae FI6-MK23]
MSNFDAIIRAAKGSAEPRSKESNLPEPTKSVKSVLDSAQSVRVLDDILDRETNTRELKQSHVEALAESISVLGLLEPLVLDSRNRLLAGAHRLAAIKVLRNQNAPAYEKLFLSNLIPVQVLPFDAEEEPDRALQVEIAENEHRRDYTPAEVRALANRLRSAGYVDQPGRPTKGTKALRPALKVIMGKSLRTVQRYLNEEQTQKPRQDVMVSEQKILHQALKKLQAWESMSDSGTLSPKRQVLSKQLPKLIKLVEEVISEIESQSSKP